MKQMRQVLAALVAVCGFAVVAGSAVAEVAVSVTITGSLEEVLPLLEQLNTLRGGEHEPAAQEGRISIQSVATMEPGEAAASEAPDPAPVIESDTPRFGAAAAEGSPAEPGDVVLLHAQLVDPHQQVDTLVGGVGSAEAYEFDLFDNGTHGDAQAHDGVWSYALPISSDWSTGEHVVFVTAFDSFGAPIRVENTAGAAEALSTTIPFAVGPVTPTEAPAAQVSAVPAPEGH
jgi:hypothetical protein